MKVLGYEIYVYCSIHTDGVLSVDVDSFNGPLKTMLTYSVTGSIEVSMRGSTLFACTSLT